MAARAGVEDVPWALGSQGGSEGGGQGQKTLCDKHEKFGEYAHYCSSPKDILLGGKRVGWGVAVAATADCIPGLLLLWQSL